MTILTSIGWPQSKVAIANGCNSWTKHIWPTIGKAKMCFSCGGFLSVFSSLDTIFNFQFLKKYATTKTHFGLDNLWSRMHNQKGIATWNINFDLAHPVLQLQVNTFSSIGSLLFGIVTRIEQVNTPKMIGPVCALLDKQLCSLSSLRTRISFKIK